MGLMDLPGHTGWQLALAPLAGWPEQRLIRGRSAFSRISQCVSSPGARSARPSGC